MIQWIWSSGWWLDYVCAACSLYQPVTLQALLRPTFDDKQKLACKHYLGQSSSPIHLLLRNIDRSDLDLESFSIVTSPANQRIEAFWSILLREENWMVETVFSSFTSCGCCEKSFCIRNCRENASDWNVQIIFISSSRYQGPRGRPDTMYFLPHLYNR